MKEKELFLNAINSLFFSWLDVPKEVYISANNMLEWYEKEYDVVLNIRFDSSSNNFNQVIERIKEL